MDTRYILTVPTQYNDGTPLAHYTLDYIAERVTDIAGGYTSTDGTGGWMSPTGTQYTEPVRLYIADCPEGYQAEDAMVELAEDLAALLDQEAIKLDSFPVTTRYIARREPVTA